ncbi:hypothetical protein EK21DRAFT_65406 [Setomelanomma holmii]|uniref:Uncharacterized protein n=1 Tax=Setomelanomma holmii TaxID=210430 RepID=A0A9P4HBX8_9PLEO|nr:hypothetical protein EK21DRAFT_65406 [Setomelanomma holmii]
MQLEALPTEIISRICQFLYRQYSNRKLDHEIHTPYNHDFQALRMVCKELYYKTEFDAADRYSWRLHELSAPFDYAGLTQLLRITDKVAFRDRLRELYIHSPVQHDQDDYSELALVRDDIIEAYQASSDAVYLLAECFRHLHGAMNLTRIQIGADLRVDVFSHAMVLAGFHQKIVYLSVQPSNFPVLGYGNSTRSLDASAACVKGLNVQPSLVEAHPSFQQLPVERRLANPMGLHLKGYRPTTPALTRFILSLNMIDSLELNGCRTHPALRICHGCDDLFARNFAQTLYPSLSRLVLDGMFISGGRLRGFIKRQARTLNTFETFFTTLTDGSWHSVAQGLAKLRLSSLQMNSLWQKRPADVNTNGVWPPRGYIPYSEVGLLDTDQIQHFLQSIVLSFRTVIYTNPVRFTKPHPMYHQVRLFRPLKQERSFGLTEATTECLQYSRIHSS